MANNVSQGVTDITGPLIGRGMIDGLWRKFSISGQILLGDDLMERSRDLLRRHYELMENHDQTKIRKRIDQARDIKDGLVNSSGSRLQRLREAKKYRHRSQVTYQTVKDASGRAIENDLMKKMAESPRPPGGGSGSGPDTGSVASMPRNPFTDSHAILTLTSVDINDLNRVEMTTYHTGDTGEAALVLDLVAQDESVQHVVATFPTEAISGDRADRGAPEALAVLSLHQEDGTMLRFLTASLPDVAPDQRLDEEAEMRTIASIAPTEVFGTSEGRSSPEPPPHMLLCP
jgi:hypothetical protein